MKNVIQLFKKGLEAVNKWLDAGWLIKMQVWQVSHFYAHSYNMLLIAYIHVVACGVYSRVITTEWTVLVTLVTVQLF